MCLVWIMCLMLLYAWWLFVIDEPYTCWKLLLEMHICQKGGSLIILKKGEANRRDYEVPISKGKFRIAFKLWIRRWFLTVQIKINSHFYV